VIAVSYNVMDYTDFLKSKVQVVKGSGFDLVEAAVRKAGTDVARGVR